MAGGQDRNFDITQEPQPASRSRSRRRRRWHPNYGAISLFALSCFGGSCVLELLAYRMAGNVLVLTGAGSALVEVIIAILSQVLQPDDTDEKPQKGDTWGKRVAMGIRNFIRRIWQNATCVLVCTIGMWVLISTGLAAVHTGGRVFGVIGSSINDIVAASEESVKVQPDPAPSPSFEEATETEPVMESEPAEETEPVTETEPDIEPASVLILGRHVIVEEPDRDCWVAQTLYRNLFYLDGKYAIEDWEDDEKISEKVEEQVDALIGEAKEDRFSVDTDWEVQRDVDEASQNEETMETSGDLDEIIAQRESIFSNHPFGEMAKLIAEDYNGYGVAYDDIGGRINTREYYWCTSIYWFQQVLTFSSSAGIVPDILRRIGARYKDLAFIYPDGSEEELRATKLSEAYSSLARSYPAG